MPYHLQFKKQMLTPQGAEWLDVDITIAEGEQVGLFGESGAGKTTLLRIIAGLTKPQEGLIDMNGDIWYNSRQHIDRQVQRRSCGFIFQDCRLFPHMTVQENLVYACRTPRNRDAIDEWLSVMGLTGLRQQRPQQLSGGQKQKVALIGALINRPKILLLDEPLSGLDMATRLNVQDEIINACRKTKVTAIVVSHDLPEIFRISQKVFVLKQGKIIKSGTPQQVLIDHDRNGLFKCTGQVLEIHREGGINTLTLSCGDQVMQLAASDEEIKGISLGSMVVVVSKAIGPVALKAA